MLYIIQTIYKHIIKDNFIFNNMQSYKLIIIKLH